LDDTTRDTMWWDGTINRPNRNNWIQDISDFSLFREH
jgi:hypothetical protein